jgi:hypothetical protein
VIYWFGKAGGYWLLDGIVNKTAAGFDERYWYQAKRRFLVAGCRIVASGFST